MQSASLVALLAAARANGAGAGAVVMDVFSQSAITLGTGGETDMAVAGYTDSAAIACYLDGGAGDTGRGACALLEDGAVTKTLNAPSDRTLDGSIAHLSESAAVWCYADSTNAYELKCRKMARDRFAGSTVMSDVTELTVKGNSGNVLGPTVISVAAFSHNMSVVCYDTPTLPYNPATSTTGPLQCGLVFVKPDDDQYAPGELGINSNTGIIMLDTGNVTTASVISLTADTGAVCYTSSGDSSDRVECTMLALSGTSEADSTIAAGASVLVKDGATSAAAEALSASTALICYTESGAGTCSSLELAGSALSKGDAELEVSSSAISHTVIEHFSNGTAVVCFQSAGGAACLALDVVGDEIASGSPLALDDASPNQGLALASLSHDSGLLCYPGSSAAICRTLQVAPKTTSTETSSETSTVSTTYATDTASSTHSETTTSAHTRTQTETTTSPHTTTGTTVTSVTTPVESDDATTAALGSTVVSALLTVVFMGVVLW